MLPALTPLHKALCLQLLDLDIDSVARHAELLAQLKNCKGLASQQAQDIIFGAHDRSGSIDRTHYITKRERHFNKNTLLTIHIVFNVVNCYLRIVAEAAERSEDRPAANLLTSSGGSASEQASKGE